MCVRAPSGEKIAVTVLAVLIVSVQVLFVPLHAPSQRRNSAPAAGVAVSTTRLPAAKRWTHFFFAPLPTHFPAEDLTVPGPLTRMVSAFAANPNVAKTLFAALMVSVHVFTLPAQAPPQRVKTAPDPDVAVSVTLEFTGTFTLQDDAPLPQKMPWPETVPRPLTVTISGTVVVEPLVKVALTA
jgi:hypothetical protein